MIGSRFGSGFGSYNGSYNGSYTSFNQTNSLRTLAPLKDTTKDLLILLYGSESQYQSATPVLLEDFIMQFDTWMGNPVRIPQICKSIGLPIIPEIDGDLYLYSILEAYLTERLGYELSEKIRPCSVTMDMIPPDTKSYLDFAANTVAR